MQDPCMFCLYKLPGSVVLSWILSYPFHLLRLPLELLRLVYNLLCVDLSIHMLWYGTESWLSYFKFVTYFQVSQFLSRQKQAKKYILVHCTHGHNRTGYMIVHYLMRSQSLSVTQVSYVLTLMLVELSLYWLLWATVLQFKIFCSSRRQ